MEQFVRTERLIGKEAVKTLKKSRVAVFGIGGVGGYAVEALARSGVGQLDLIDSDTVSVSNINRQLIALHSTVGQYKVDVMRDRIQDINPEIMVRTYRCFFLPENQEQFPFSEYSYVVDAVDTVAAKLSLVEMAKAKQVPVISCMGAGNKLHADSFAIADIYETAVCPLARVMRRELKKRGITDLKVVYSKEQPIAPNGHLKEEGQLLRKQGEGGFQKQIPGSISFVPAVAGLLLAGEVIKDLTGWNCSDKM